MFNNVVVGVDEHYAGRGGIALAQSLFSRGGKLTLAHVLTSDPYFYRGVSAAVAESQRRDAVKLLETARERMGIDAELRCERSSSVGRGLHELADGLGADLLVLGSSSRGLLGRVVLGDDTHASLNGAPCAVAIAPAGYGDGSRAIAEVGVGYDGSPESEVALEVARVIAAAHAAGLSACEVVSVPTSVLGPGPLPLSDTTDRLVRGARDRIDDLGGVRSHAVYGQPAEELAIFSASVDLLVVGSRGYGPLGRLVHGSTSAQLVRKARCPLLVLPRTGAGSASCDAETGQASVAMSGR
jgi:nucleotide-binding universal stress UspA family protein